MTNPYRPIPFSLWLSIAALVVVLALPAALAAKENANAAPDFALSTLDGKTLRKKDLRGKVVVLDFWATWCGPCLKALPELKSLAAQMKGEPFTLISVSVDNDKDDIAAFAREHGMTWTQAWDSSGELAAYTFRIESFPTYIVLDHEGGVAHRQFGWSPGRTARNLEMAVKKAVAAARQAKGKSDVAR